MRRSLQRLQDPPDNLMYIQDLNIRSFIKVARLSIVAEGRARLQTAEPLKSTDWLDLSTGSWLDGA